MIMAVISGHLTALTASSDQWATRGAWSALYLQPMFTWWSVSSLMSFQKGKLGVQTLLSLASMSNDTWEPNHFADRPMHGITIGNHVWSASVTAINHHGTIFKSLTVDANFPWGLCASVCFMYSSPDLNTNCHFYLIENNNCYLGNAFHTNGDTLPATPTHLVYKMNQSK